MNERLRKFLQEDLTWEDITTSILIPDRKVRAEIITKSDGIVAGVEEAVDILRGLGADVKQLRRDGDEIKSDDVIMEIIGDTKTLLKAERTILNILMRMSGIATMTREAINKVGSDIRIAATRKTTPGFRRFEKKAVIIGGGDPHRFNLSDMILIKDNHLKVIGSVSKAVKLAVNRKSITKLVEVEVKTLEESMEAIQSGADIIMLDNVEPNETKRIIDGLKAKQLRNKILIEVSGGITLDNVTEYARTGVDIISMGCLTHSPKALNMSLEIEVNSAKDQSRTS